MVIHVSKWGITMLANQIRVAQENKEQGGEQGTIKKNSVTIAYGRSDDRTRHDTCNGL